MRDEQDSSAVVLQVLLQPLNRLDVKVVCRLVQQKDRRTAQEQLGQLDTHAPTARKLGRRTLKIATLETKAQQGLLDISLARVATQNRKAILRLIEAVQQVGIGLALIVRALGNLGRQTCDLLLQRIDLLKGLGRLLDERRCVVHTHRLRQVAERTLRTNGHGTRRGLLFTHDQAQQGRLTRAVASHQTDAVFGIDQERDVIKKGPTAIRDGEVIE